MDNPSPGKISYDFTLDDCENSMREPLIQKALRKNMMAESRNGLVFCGLLGAVIGAPFASLFFTHPSTLGTIATALAAGVALPGVLLLLSIKGLRRFPVTHRNAVQRGAHGDILGPQTIELRDDGLFCTSPRVDVLIRWVAIQRIERGTYGMLFVLGPVRATMIPHRAFEGHDAAKFESTARELHARAGTHTS